MEKDNQETEAIVMSDDPKYCEQDLVAALDLPRRNNHGIVWFVPNIMGYARIMLALASLFTASHNPMATALLWLLSGSLDLFDGMAARWLNQCSTFGAALDVIADNILRSVMWIVAITCTTSTSSHENSSPSPMFLLLAVTCITMEWLTFCSTQIKSLLTETHWKSVQDGDKEESLTTPSPPWLVKIVFTNNFCNPLGLLCMYGIFGAAPTTYFYNHVSSCELFAKIPCITFLMNLAYCGRILAFTVEAWMCQYFFTLLLQYPPKQHLVPISPISEKKG
mmetsp:Transcript_7461/g.13424  ORF Transcript_7461/g.13424 Transcript_7461/m.13424 type:complete len:279 (-) Transcript_7461:1435-2271(-)